MQPVLDSWSVVVKEWAVTDARPLLGSVGPKWFRVGREGIWVRLQPGFLKFLIGKFSSPWVDHLWVERHSWGIELVCEDRDRVRHAQSIRFRDVPEDVAHKLNLIPQERNPMCA